jgi:hypothetical protein
LSVARGALATPQEAFERYTSSGLASAGVWSVSVEESRAIDLGVVDDPLPDDSAHAFVDFRPYAEDKKKQKSRAQLLARAANDRECRYAKNQ